MKIKILKFLRRIFIFVFLLVANAWLYTKIFWPTTALDVPEALANQYAKEICSCMFVSGLGRVQCLADNKSLMKPSFIRVNVKHKEVYAKVWWAESFVRYQSDRYGCQILTSQGT